MIVQMKRVSILSAASGKKEITTALRNFGALHLEIQEKTSSYLEELRERESLIRQAFQAIPEASPRRMRKMPSPSEAPEPAPKLAEKVMESANLLKAKEAEAETLRREIMRIENWGDFDPALFQSLLESGTALSLAVLSNDELKGLPETTRYIILSRKKNKRQLLFIGDTGDLDCTFLRLPERSLSSLQQGLEALVQEQLMLKEKLMNFQSEKKILEHYLESLAGDIEFASVQGNLEEFEECPSVTLIQGFLPLPRLEDFRSFAAAKGAAFIIQDPGPEDNVPTKVENPRAIRITEPIFQFMDTLPGYKEHDISFWFLIFFTLFFAMIIGDAGYGLLLSLLSLGSILVTKIKTERVPDVLILFTTLGLGTLFWGALSGNWFGYAPIGELPFFSQFIIPGIYAFAEGIANDVVVETLLLFCFSLGMGHLLLAHLLSCIKKLKEPPRIHGFADLGWISTMVGLYFFVLNLVVDSEKYPIPSIAIPLIFGGLIAVLLFDGQQGDGFFRGLGRTLNIGNLIYTALTAISSFADVISYIRLFAVGLASVEIARSFNNMAGGIMQAGTGIAVIAGIVVLLLGHSLNLVMAGLSVLVHGIRLKMLEFSGHLGNEWTGLAYRPFKNS